MKTVNRFTTILATDENTTRHYAEIRLQLASADTPIPMTVKPG